MRIERAIAALVASFAGITIYGCSAVTSGSGTALAFSGSYSGSVARGEVSSQASITIGKGDAVTGFLTNCPAPGHVSTFKGTLKASSATSGSAKVNVSTSSGSRSLSSTGDVAFTYSGGMLLFALTDNSLGGTINVAAT